MTRDNGNLIWIDLEMTGLDPDNDRIIEIATIVTDGFLSIVEEGPVIGVTQSRAVLDTQPCLCMWSVDGVDHLQNVADDMLNLPADRVSIITFDQ